MKSLTIRIVTLAVVLVSSVHAEELIEIEPDENGVFVLPATKLQQQSWNVKTPTPNIVNLEYRRRPGQEEASLGAGIAFHPDDEQKWAYIFGTPNIQLSKTFPDIIIECAEESGQQADGRILFTAADARVVGNTAKLETHHGNSRIGFWTDLDNRVEWDYEATRPGTYRVSMCYSRSGQTPAKVQLRIGENTLNSEIKSTGSWYHYRSIQAGKVKIPGKGKLKVSVQGIESAGALMNLKGIVLTPVSEGKAVQTAGEDGVILCRSRDATIHGVKAQYEPKPEKNTVGFWTNVQDRVSWDVKFERPGAYDFQILQGCGKGHGGSKVKIVMGEQALSMTVEDTGHFQNFKPRVIGQFKIDRPGVRRVTIVPVTKASVAVMDVRQVRFIPVSPN